MHWISRFVILITTALLLSISGGCDVDRAKEDRSGFDEDGTKLFARTGVRYFEVFDDNGWKKITIKGVNIGTSLPGRWYTEFPADRALYRSWLEDIAAMNANTVRLYTLLDPAFYAVFAEYNREPENEPLWLIQEIWPHDEVPNLNFHDQAYREAYKREIKLVIDALHGNADIPARPFRAYGNYSVNITPYLLGVLIGRELEPDEVAATNEANPGLSGYSGAYVQALPGSTATEAWLAEMCDLALQYSQSFYGQQYPVGFVSWPTLDPLTHPTEWEADGTPGYNDRETVDPNVFSTGPQNRAGFFGAYHIYPNYPDFMNNEPAFAEYSDGEGIFRYRGYLNKFMAIHPSYPALVAEFGISTSLNTAHLNPDGLHHGGLTEIEQGEMIVRMMRSILDEGYAGGLIFEWTDEWAKKTWNTEPFMIPYERQVLWQNAMCPEQNYGLMAVEPLQRPFDELFESWYRSTNSTVSIPAVDRDDLFGKIRSIETGADEAYFYLAITLDPATLDENGMIPWNEFSILAAIDIGFRDGGELNLPLEGLPALPSGAEFLLHIESPEQGVLLAAPSYNRGDLDFSHSASKTGRFTRIKTLVNRERITADGRIFTALYADESILGHGHLSPKEEDYRSTAHWFNEEESGRIIVRLPWMLLNVSDPSSLAVLSDQGRYLELPGRDILGTAQSEGFLIYAATSSEKGNGTVTIIDYEPRQGNQFASDLEPYLWPTWEEPLFQFRIKMSYPIIAAYFDSIR